MKQLPRIAAKIFCEPWSILPGAHAQIVRQFRDTKDINFTYRKRKDSRKAIGHRQYLTALKVTKILA